MHATDPRPNVPAVRTPPVPDAPALGAGVLCYAVAPQTGELFFLLGKESGGAADARLDCEPPTPFVWAPTEDASRSPGRSNNDDSSSGDDSGSGDDAAVAAAPTPPPVVPTDGADAATPPYAPCRRTRRVHRWSDFGGRVEPDETEEEAAAREFFEETLGLVCTDSCVRSAHRTAARGSVDVGARAGHHGDADRRALAGDLAAGRYALKVRTCLNHGAGADLPRRYHVTFVKRIPWMPSVVLQFARIRSQLAAMARDARCRSASAIVVSDGDHGPMGHVHPELAAALGSDGSVRGEYIEKDYLQFWSVRRLRQALDNGGCFRREHLRPLFVPVIAVVLDVMAPRPVPAVIPGHADDGWPGAVRVQHGASARVPEGSAEPAATASTDPSVYTVYCRALRPSAHKPADRVVAPPDPVDATP